MYSTANRVALEIEEKVRNGRAVFSHWVFQVVLLNPLPSQDIAYGNASKIACSLPAIHGFNNL